MIWCANINLPTDKSIELKLFTINSMCTYILIKNRSRAIYYEKDNDLFSHLFN